MRALHLRCTSVYRTRNNLFHYKLEQCVDCTIRVRAFVFRACIKISGTRSMAERLCCGGKDDLTNGLKTSSTSNCFSYSYEFFYFVAVWRDYKPGEAEIFVGGIREALDKFLGQWPPRQSTSREQNGN